MTGAPPFDPLTCRERQIAALAGHIRSSRQQRVLLRVGPASPAAAGALWARATDDHCRPGPARGRPAGRVPGGTGPPLPERQRQPRSTSPSWLSSIAIGGIRRHDHGRGERHSVTNVLSCRSSQASVPPAATDCRYQRRLTASRHVCERGIEQRWRCPAGARSRRARSCPARRPQSSPARDQHDLASGARTIPRAAGRSSAHPSSGRRTRSAGAGSPRR